MSENQIKVFVARGTDGTYYVMANGLPAEMIFGGPYTSRHEAEREARKLCIFPIDGKFDPWGSPS